MPAVVNGGHVVWENREIWAATSRLVELMDDLERDSWLLVYALVDSRSLGPT